VVWSGDNEHHEIDEVTQKYNFDITNYIAKQTKAAFPDKRIQFCVGNHEHFPVDNLDMVASAGETKGIWFYETFTSAYQPLLSQDAFKNFKSKGFYSEYFSEFNIRFINLLSAPMDTYNFFLFVYKYDPTGQFEWMWDVLREAEKNGEFVYVHVHIPPGGDGTHQLWDELFNDTIERFRNTIRGIFSGHTHIDELKWTRERADNSKVVHTNFISPSLTTFGGMQPSFRVFEVDRDSGVITDMIQYRLDLEKWNAVDPSIDPTWDVIYRFKTDYQLEDMSNASMQGLYDNLMNDRQPYLNNYLSHLNSGKPNNSWKLKKLHLESNDYLCLHCDFNTEVREYTKCLGWKLFTDFRGDWLDLFLANMFTHYMKFN
jgi:sphingomyelin phosphodiesterase